MATPLSLYIHFPWCIEKCPYCDFNSHPKRGELPEQEYLQALIGDLRADVPLAGNRTIDTVFIGGGTPSLMQPATIASVLQAADELVGLNANAEITMEANPGAIEHHSFEGYLQAGVTRLSLGVQSFCNAHLQRLGRVHDAAAAFSAFAAARAAGFENINLDVMYGLPGQSLDDALADIDCAIELAPEHLSHYHLTMEQGTAFGRQPPTDLPDEDVTWEMLTGAQKKLAAAGFGRYEVSAYAKAGRECRHNLNYWRYGDYLGVGAGAHGKLTNASGRIIRTIKKNKPALYQQQPEQSRIEISGDDARFEFMLNNLRLTDGFSVAQLAERCGTAGSVVMKQIQVACEKGLLEQADSDTFRPTELGMRFLDDLQALFLPPISGDVAQSPS